MSNDLVVSSVRDNQPSRYDTQCHIILGLSV